MPKFGITRAEWYPVFVLEPEESTYADEIVELTEEEFAGFTAIWERFEEWQRKLSSLARGEADAGD